jgi:hypothetical protein
LSLAFLLMNEGMVTVTGGVTGTYQSTVPEEPLTPESTDYGSSTTWVLDKEKSFLNISVLENNTMALERTENGIVTTFQNNMDALLANYLANTEKAIWVNVPLTTPLEAFCSAHPEVREICDCIGTNADKIKMVNGVPVRDCEAVQEADDSLDDLLEDSGLTDAGVSGIQLDDLLIGMTGSAYLGETDEETLGSFNSSPRHLLMGLGICFRDEETGQCVEGNE